MVTLPDFNFETSQIPPPTRFVLGIDEVGRGPLAGPVTIGVFLLDLQNFNPSTFLDLGVRDSKLLSVQKRQIIFSYFRQHHFTYSVFSASSTKIDQQGIGVVIKGLILYALKYYHHRFDFCLIDGNYDFKTHSELVSISTVKSVIKADQSCFSVAAASICAKVCRDLVMDNYDLIYPHYGFKQHKGYGTKKHLSALHQLGPCPIHRRSFKPINTLSKKPITNL